MGLLMYLMDYVSGLIDKNLCLCSTLHSHGPGGILFFSMEGRGLADTEEDGLTLLEGGGLSPLTHCFDGDFPF